MNNILYRTVYNYIGNIHLYMHTRALIACSQHVSVL